jgi:protoporphyrin/coproporphyrin ferrochelatase
MAFHTEPPYAHGSPARTAVILCNLGTPDAPNAPALRRYLGEFLSDGRVVEIPKAVWWLILNGIILRLRPAKSAAKYATVWTEQGSPLKVWTERQAKGLGDELQSRGEHVEVRYAMRYGNPSIPSVLDELKAQGMQRVLIMSAYPQYSGTTTASVFDAVAHWGLKTRHLPEMRFINRYHDDTGYIQALAAKIQAHWSAHGRNEHLLMSFHGVPERTLHKGDPYHCECHKTARLLAEQLGLGKDQYSVTFQSRFGKAKWLEPYTEPTLMALAQKGIRTIDVACPGFTSDCLETLEEINMEAREAFLHAGGERFAYIDCLNDSSPWLQAMADLAQRHLQGWPTQALPDAQTLADSQSRALAMGAAR